MKRKEIKLRKELEKLLSESRKEKEKRMPMYEMRPYGARFKLRTASGAKVFDLFKAHNERTL